MNKKIKFKNPCQFIITPDGNIILPEFRIKEGIDPIV